MVEIEFKSNGDTNIFMNKGWNRIFETSNENFELEKIGTKNTLKTWFGITVVVSGNEVSIKLPGTYSGGTSGICANNNGRPNDDYTTEEGYKLFFPIEQESGSNSDFVYVVQFALNCTMK
jgi:hypothetical protein